MINLYSPLTELELATWQGFHTHLGLWGMYTLLHFYETWGELPQHKLLRESIQRQLMLGMALPSMDGADLLDLKHPVTVGALYKKTMGILRLCGIMWSIADTQDTQIFVWFMCWRGQS